MLTEVKKSSAKIRNCGLVNFTFVPLTTKRNLDRDSSYFYIGKSYRCFKCRIFFSLVLSCFVSDKRNQNSRFSRSSIVDSEFEAGQSQSSSHCFDRSKFRYKLEISIRLKGFYRVKMVTTMQYFFCFFCNTDSLLL